VSPIHVRSAVDISSFSKRLPTVGYLEATKEVWIDTGPIKIYLDREAALYVVTRLGHFLYERDKP